MGVKPSFIEHLYFVSLINILKTTRSKDMSAAVNAAEIFPTLIQNISSSFDPGLLVPEGKFLVNGLGAIAIAWISIKNYLSGEGFNHLIAQIISLIFVVGIVNWTISGADSVVPQIKAGFDQVARKINPESDVSPAIQKMMGSALSLFADDAPDAATPEAKSAWQRFKGAVSSVTDFSISEMFWSIVSGGFKLLTVLLILFCAVAYVGVFILSQVLFDIAWFFAPIFVPWLILPSFSWIAQGWFQFLVSAGVTKLVGAAMLGATFTFIQKATELAATAENEPVVNFSIYSTTFLLMGVMAFLMLQVTNIAGGLLRGFNQSSFSLHAAQQSATRMVNSSPGVAATKVKNIAQRFGKK